MPSLFDEEDSPLRVAELSDTGTPEQDTVALVTPCTIAEPSDASISKAQYIAIYVSVARKVTHHTPVNETKPLVVGHWLSDKDIIPPPPPPGGYYYCGLTTMKSVSHGHGLQW